MDHRDELTAKLLRGDQSVRVTFKISEEYVRLFSLTAEQLGIQRKRLFDQLLGDRAVLVKIAGQEGKSEAATARPTRVQKTYVLSRGSLEVLREIAESQGIARDTLVERSIERLRPVLSDEREKQRRWRQAAARFSEFAAAAENLFMEMAEILMADKENGEARGPADDPILRQAGEAVTAIRKAHDEIGRLLVRSDFLRARLEEDLGEG